MGINYKNLDETTRKFMLDELEKDIEGGKLFISSRLNSAGKSNWAGLLKEAIVSYDDDWLAGQLNMGNFLETYEERKTSIGRIISAKVPRDAANTLAEGEFNRFYARGLCARAIDEGIDEVVVYRGKQVKQPRPGSENKIGKRFKAKDLLEDLRKSQGVDPALGIPSGPNSGLTICLP
jgi:hypothetical protein